MISLPVKALHGNIFRSLQGVWIFIYICVSLFLTIITTGRFIEQHEEAK
jgi:hypothetical protein